MLCHSGEEPGNKEQHWLSNMQRYLCCAIFTNKFLIRWNKHLQPRNVHSFVISERGLAVHSSEWGSEVQGLLANISSTVGKGHFHHLCSLLSQIHARVIFILATLELGHCHHICAHKLCTYTFILPLLARVITQQTYLVYSTHVTVSFIFATFHLGHCYTFHAYIYTGNAFTFMNFGQGHCQLECTYTCDNYI